MVYSHLQRNVVRPVSFRSHPATGNEHDDAWGACDDAIDSDKTYARSCGTNVHGPRQQQNSSDWKNNESFAISGGG